MTSDATIQLRSADGATAELFRHGAHVTSWRPASDGEERLFLSRRSEFTAGAAIRGGIPIIFPQFAAEGPLPRHGFARTSDWAPARVERHSDGDASLELELRDTPRTREIWPLSFRALLGVRVGGDALRVTLTVENTGHERMAFTCALHSYLRVRDVADVELVGLHGAPYRVSGSRDLQHSDNDEVLRVKGEIDRVYVGVPRRLTLREPHRALAIEGEGFPDAVIWNPGAERAAALPDMEPDGERRMLCVEAAVVQQPVELEPGRRFSGSCRLVALAGSDGRS